MRCNSIPTPTRNDKVRFWSKVRITPSCWIWAGNKNNRGYGLFVIRKKLLLAHRVSYAMAFGDTPVNMVVRHYVCNNPLCVNPHHLRIGTIKDNAMDMVRAGRAATGDNHGMRLHPERRPRGEHHGIAKLTDAQVMRIRQQYATGRFTKADLAREYHVTRGTIRRVVTGQGWTHLPLVDPPS